jgi:voltage-gated sodium channel
MRQKLRAIVDSPAFQRFILVLIGVNAITLGLETSPSVMQAWGDLLLVFDGVVLAIFVVELLMRIGAHGLSFFRGGWNWFDLVIVVIALVPASGSLSVLRALRIVRVFRVISAVPSMRVVVEALLKSIPGLSSIIALLMIVFYVFAVMATNLFGDTNPALFGSLGRSLYALLQVMTLEGWSGDIVNPVLEHHRYALLFFIPFMLLSTFTVLNLFIALIVDSMQKLGRDEGANDDRPELLAAIARLHDEVRELRRHVERGR